jgi:hypothetical protein
LLHYKHWSSCVINWTQDFPKPYMYGVCTYFGRVITKHTVYIHGSGQP